MRYEACRAQLRDLGPRMLLGKGCSFCTPKSINSFKDLQGNPGRMARWSRVGPSAKPPDEVPIETLPSFFY